MAQTKVAIVTGSSAISFEICRHLACNPNIEIILTVSNQNDAKIAAENLDYPNVSFRPLDSSSPKSIKELIEYIKENFNRLDILINNIGLFSDDPVDWQKEIETVKQSVETNNYAALLLCQSAIPLMKQSGSGRIVNMAFGLTTLENDSLLLRVSEIGLSVVTRVLAHKLKSDNILVNAICPNLMNTSNKALLNSIVNTVVWLALLPNDGPTGQLFQDHQLIVS